MAQPPTESPDITQVKRGEIWYVRLSGSSSTETWQLTPCAVLQDDEINKSGSFDTVVVVPLTMKVPEPEHQTSFDIILPARQTGLPKDSMAVWTLIRSVRPDRFLKKTGIIEADHVDRMARYICILMGLK